MFNKKDLGGDMNPSKEIINQKLAEYMAKADNCCIDLATNNYTDSLDTLVPIWEKLYGNERFSKKIEFWLGCIRGQWECMFNKTIERHSSVVIDEQGQSPQYIAALATYKAIIAMEKEGE